MIQSKYQIPIEILNEYCTTGYNKYTDFIKFLNCELDVYMTGTAIERVISPLDNVGDNIIRWSYTDMLMVQNGEHPIQQIFV